MKPTLLAIGVVGLRARTKLFDFYTASTIREALATIRLMYVDVLMVGLDNPKLDIWDLMQRVLAAWPHQRWLLASRHVTAEDEVQARSMGALMVLDTVPDERWLAEFAASLRRRDLSRSMRTCVSVDPITPFNDGVALSAKAS